jgi:hypothetical protein
MILAAVGEASTGLALLIVPGLVGRLLLGEELSGIAIPVARVAGIALIALGLACWPATPRVGMLAYSAAVTLYLAYLGVSGSSTGTLLWPAVVLHAALRCARASRRSSHSTGSARACAPTRRGVWTPASKA